jgi:hypothetical protein
MRFNKTILFWGDVESDTGQWVAVTVNGSAQSVAKAITTNESTLTKFEKAIPTNTKMRKIARYKSRAK